jgi:hypothetical protein
LDPALLAMMQPLSVTGYDFKDAAWDQKVLGYYAVGGKQYAVSMANTLIQQPMVIYYDKALINQFDLEDPYTLWKKDNWTWNKFIEICTDFKKEVGDQYEVWSPTDWQDIASDMGLGLVSFDGNKFVSNISNTDLLNSFKEMSKLYHSGITTTFNMRLTNFEQSKLLFFTDSIIGARKTHFYHTDKKSKGTLGVVPLPKVEGLSKQYQQFSEYEAYGIVQGAKNASAVPYFLRYYLDASNYNADGFFSDRSILEVYKSCMAQPNVYVNSLSTFVVTKDLGKNSGEIMLEVRAATPEQVTTVLMQNAPLITQGVKNANDKLAEIK